MCSLAKVSIFNIEQSSHQRGGFGEITAELCGEGCVNNVNILDV